MREFTTTEGHKLLAGHDPSGIRIAIIPAEPPLDDNVVDYFGMGINFANLTRAIHEIDLPNGFQGEGWDCSMLRKGNQIYFSFIYKHAPHKQFSTSLSTSDSQQLVGFFHESLDGRTYGHEEGFELAQPSKVGRNDPCPCGSGKKYKKCCGKPTAIQSPPPALQVFQNVQDPIAKEVISEAHRRPNRIKDAVFWMELGCTLGTAEEYPMALIAFKTALNLDHNNPQIVANYAATLGGAGRNAEALKLLESLPNETGEFSVLIGNVLCGLDRKTEAIKHFEKAVEFDPDFYFPWKQLLHVLKATSNPLYDYWINRARRQLPQTPAIALAYAHWLICENRLEELAEATWVDHLEHKPDPRIMGRAQEDPQMIVEIQVLRMIAKSLASEDTAPLETATKVLDAASNDWHLCVPAEQIALAARFFGRRDLVWRASRSFCKGCAESRLGPVYIRTLLAQAAASAGDNDRAILDAEAGLKEQPEDLTLRNVYWWALDEVGRSDEALEVAKGVQKEISDLPHLCYNIGYIASKTGKPATAITYYTREIEQESDHPFAFENLALHRLIQGDISSAQQLVSQWQTLVSSSCDPAEIEAYLSKFEKLTDFVKNNAGSVSLSFDLLKLNECSEPFFGAETKIHHKSPTREDIVSALTSTDPEANQDITYAVEMEQRGDFSSVVASLEAELPGFRAIPINAFISIVEAQRQLDDSSRADFAPCCMAFCKGLEIFLFTQIFQAFRKDALCLESIGNMIEEADDPDFKKADALTRFISKSAPLELGTMAFTLNLCCGRTAKKMRLLASLRKWVETKDYGILFTHGVADNIAHIAANYRNPSTHTRTFSQNDAAEAKALCFEQLGSLLGKPS
jgi:tetratricopeptide (TPR) repeat protein